MSTKLADVEWVCTAHIDTSIFGSSRKYKTRRTTRKPLILIWTAIYREDFCDAALIDRLEDEREQEEQENALGRYLY
jgi:hypothetical protein